jgi:hypothetical protein
MTHPHGPACRNAAVHPGDLTWVFYFVGFTRTR